MNIRVIEGIPECMQLYSLYDRDTVTFPDSSHSVSSYLAQIRVLRATVDALNKTVDEKATRLKEECWDNILVRGIAELPDELLALVFELAYDNDTDGSHLAIQLSHVCRRFRAVALHTPRLWSTLAASQRPDEYQTFISRSRTADLTIIVDFPFRKPSFMLIADFMNDVFPLSNRWGELQFHRMPLFDDEWGAFRELTDIDVFLPRLQTLVVAGCHRKWDWNFWSHWDMPGLRHFESYDAIPSGLNSASLVSCDLQFSSLRFTGVVINGLLVALQTCPALQTLALDFESIQQTFENPEAEVALLGQLKTMTIRIAGLSKSGTIRPIIRNVVMPCLDRIDYDIEMNDDLESKTFLTDIFPPMPHCHNLRSVHMKVETFEYDFHGINTIFSSFPQIHHLHLEAPLFGHVTYPASEPEGTFPPLRSLSLKNCMLLSDKYGLGLMLEAMHIHGRYWDKLERIEVIGNSDAPAMQLYDSIQELVKGKIFFS